MAYQMKNNITIITGDLNSSPRKNKEKEIISYKDKIIDFTYIEGDTLNDFEQSLTKVCGESSFLYNIKTKFSTLLLSVISVTIILFALISSSLYEDIFKKILFETPFDWTINDSISILFVLLFFFGLLMMPSILEGESSQLKNGLISWFNKDTRKSKILTSKLKQLNKNSIINIYNIDTLESNHWTWRLLIPILLNNYKNINFYTRKDKKKTIDKRLKLLGQEDIKFKDMLNSSYDLDVVSLLSTKENNLYTLMQLSSSLIIDNNLSSKHLVSLELFEYCGRNFYTQKEENNSLISGFQNFINRAYNDFDLIEENESGHICFSSIMVPKDIEEEKKRLSYYLRNHIEECLKYFDNPISLLILYYYVKDIVIDEKRIVLILDKLVLSIKNKQQYNLIERYWFDIAGKMFDSSNIDNHEFNNKNIYRKLSIETLDNLKLIFERNGYFEESLKIAKYLFQINPNKYSIDISSLYERKIRKQKCMQKFSEKNRK